MRGPSHPAPAVAAALAQSALESRAPLAAGAGDPQMRAAIIASLEVGRIMCLYVVYILDTIYNISILNTLILYPMHL